METYKLELIIDGKKAEATLNVVGNDLKKFKQTASQPTDLKVNGKNALATFRDITVAAQGVSMAYRKVSQAARYLYERQRDQEASDRKLQNTLKATGNQLNLLESDFKGLASRIQRATGIGDEIISKDVISNMLTFKSINMPDVFSRATKAAVDLSAQFEGDLKSSTIALSKALEDPVKGITALSRVGVTFSETEKDMIASMVEMGQKADAQRVILAALEGQTKGAAEAMADPVKKLSANWGDLVEILGESLVPVLNNIVPQMSGFFKDLHEWAIDSNKYMQDAFQITEKWGEATTKAIEDKIAAGEREMAQLKKDSEARMAYKAKESRADKEAAVAKVNDNSLRREAIENEIKTLQKLITQKEIVAQQEAEAAENQRVIRQANSDAQLLLDEMQAELSQEIIDEANKKELEAEKKQTEELKKQKNKEIADENAAYLKKLEILKTQKDNGLATIDELKAAQTDYLAFTKRVYGENSLEYQKALADMKAANLTWGNQIRKQWKDAFAAQYDDELEQTQRTQIEKQDAYVEYLSENLKKDKLSADERIALEEDIAKEAQKAEAMKRKWIEESLTSTLSAGANLMSAYQGQNEEMFKVGKAFAYSSAVVNTALGVTQALKSYPPPLSIIMAAIQSAAGAAEIATISKAKFKAETGGYLVGPSHSRGGIPLEAEGGEYVIRERVVRALGKDFFDQINFGVPAVASRERGVYANGGLISSGLNMQGLLAEIQGLRDDLRSKEMSFSIVNEISANDVIKKADPTLISRQSETGTRKRALI